MFCVASVASTGQAEHLSSCLLTLFVTQHGFLFGPACSLTGILLIILCLQILPRIAVHIRLAVLLSLLLISPLV